MPRHKLTPDDRRRGQAKGAETKRARRDEAEQEARDTLADAAGEAVATLVSELKAENPADRIRAAAQILDRAWGRPRQQLEASVDLTPSVIDPEVDAGRVLEGLAELGLIGLPGNGAADG